jgi:hypothetical protein
MNIEKVIPIAWLFIFITIVWFIVVTLKRKREYSTLDKKTLTPEQTRLLLADIFKHDPQKLLELQKHFHDEEIKAILWSIHAGMQPGDITEKAGNDFREFFNTLIFWRSMSKTLDRVLARKLIFRGFPDGSEIPLLEEIRKL